MKITSVGKTLEVGLYVALIAFTMKIIATLIFGYIFLPARFAGLIIYYWRREFCDAEAAKQAYSFIDPNTEDFTQIFSAYSGIVQPSMDPKKFKSKLAQLEKQVEKYPNDEELAKELEKLKSSKKDCELTTKKTSPLYSIGKFTDSFVLGPKKSFKIFAEKKTYKTKAFNAESDFLAFRYVFLSYLSTKQTGKEYNKDGKLVDKTAKNYFSVPYQDIAAFFEDSTILNGATTVDGVTTIKNEKLGSKEIRLTEEQFKGVKGYIQAYPIFNNIVALLKENTALITFSDNKATIDTKLMDLVKQIVTTLGLEELLNEHDGVETAFTNFIERLAVLKPNAFDAHVLNRIYYYYLFTNSHLSPDVSEDSKYGELEKQVKKIDASIKEMVDSNQDLAGNSAFHELVLKREIFADKLDKKRVEIIFNSFSEIISQNMGDKGIAISSEKDDRIFLLKYFVYPGMYSESQLEKVKPDNLVSAAAA